MDNPTNKVIWAEGVLLGQQHLQQWDKYYQTQQKIINRNIAPLAWGLTKLQIDEESLTSGQFRIQHCQAIYPDGTLIHYNSTEDSGLSCQLQPTTDKKTTVYLCLPINQSISAITGYNNPQTDCTFKAHYKPVADLYDAQREREVLFGKLNLSLKQNDVSTEGFHYLKIAELIHTGNEAYHLAKDFIPTTVNIKVAPALINIAEQLLININAKIKPLIALHPTVDDTMKLLLLQILNGSMVQLRHLTQHPPTHPEQLFITLANLASQLGIFKEGFAVDNLPIYKHEDLTGCFMLLNAMLLDLLDVTTPERMAAIQLQRENDSLYTVANIDSSLLNNAAFFLAVYCKAQTTDWIEQFARQVKVGSKAIINQLVTSALPGVKTTHTQRTPAKLAIKPGYEYFRLEPLGEFWEQIITDKSMAVFLPHDFTTATIELITIPK